MIRVEVTESRCVAGGQCVVAAPEVFDQRDEDGVVIVLRSTLSEDQLAEAKRAERVCPASAIRVFSDA